MTFSKSDITRKEGSRHDKKQVQNEKGIQFLTLKVSLYDILLRINASSVINNYCLESNTIGFLISYVKFPLKKMLNMV